MILGTQDKDFFPTDWAEKLAFVKSLGLNAFEVDGAALRAHTQTIQTAANNAGVAICTACGGYRGWLGDFQAEKRREAIADIQEILHALAEVGGAGVVAPAAWGMHTNRLPPMTPPRSKEEDTAVLLDSLAQLEKTAAQTGTFIFFEPLNRYQDHMVNLVSEAAALIAQGGFAHVKITADFYHMNIEEDSIPETLRAFVPQIGHIHLADNQRYQPGSGAIRFGECFAALLETGYAGAMVFEGRLRGADPLQAFREGVSFVQAVYHKTAEEVL